MGTYNDVLYDNENVSWSFRLNNKLTLPGKIDWQTRMNVRGPNETAISKSDGDFSIDLAFSKELFKDNATLTLNIKVLESGRVFGRQVDSSYDDGHQLIAEIGDELKASILIRKTESEVIENASTGNSIELDLRFLGYDSLYQRAIFGRIAPNEEPPVIETIIEKPESEPIEEVSKPFKTDSLSPSIESNRVEISNEGLLAEPIEVEIQEEENDQKFNFPKSKPLKKESKPSEKEKKCKQP